MDELGGVEGGREGERRMVVVVVNILAMKENEKRRNRKRS